MSSSAIVEESEPLQRNLDGWVGAKGEFKVKVSANSERAMCTLVAHPGFVHVLGATQLIMSLAFLHSHDCAEPHTDAVWSLAWGATDATISASADGSLKIWNSASGQLSRDFPAHTLGLTSLSASADGRRALTNSVDGLTTLWDLETGDAVGKYESYAPQSGTQSEPAWSISLHPSGISYAASGASGNITIHSADTSTFGDVLSTLSSGRSKFGLACAYSPDGTRIALSSETGQVYVFDLASNTLISTYTSHAMAVRKLSWSPDSQLLITASEDKRLVVHDARITSASARASGAAVATLTGHSSWVLSSDISPDNRLLVSGSSDKSVKVWDIGARAAVSTVRDAAGGGDVWAVAWRPLAPVAGGAVGGAWVCGGDDGVVRWYRAAG